MHQPKTALHTPPAAPASSAPALDRLRGRLMRQSLTQLLNKVHGVRQALPHLAALETALDEHGPAVLGGMSRPVLGKLCSQLSGLPLPADDPPLQDLLERLMQALESSPVASTAAVQAAQGHVRLHDLSDFLTDDKLLVAEASYTDFAAAADEFAATKSDVL